MKKRSIGIHIRLQNNMLEGLEKAERLGLNFYQSFLMDEGGNYFSLSDEQITEYVAQAKEKNIDAVIHAAYWSSIMKIKSRGYHALKQEAEVVERLQRHSLVVHSGSVKGMSVDPVERAQSVAEVVDNFMDAFPNVQLLLENSPHGGLSYGGDLDDFALLLQQVKDPDRVAFCIDTSHAHAYGYDIVDGFDDFLQIIDKTISFKRVKLLHLNDTLKKQGSKIDKHGLFGEGLIGLNILKKFVQCKELQQASVILELPKMEEAEEVKVLGIINQWV